MPRSTKPALLLALALLVLLPAGADAKRRELLQLFVAAPYRELQAGGVPAVWELIKRDEGGEFTEIFEHPSRDIMGIGVRVRR